MARPFLLVLEAALTRAELSHADPPDNTASNLSSSAERKSPAYGRVAFTFGGVYPDRVESASPTELTSSRIEAPQAHPECSPSSFLIVRRLPDRRC